MLTLLTGQANLSDVGCPLAALDIGDQLGCVGVKHVMLDEEIGSKDKVEAITVGRVEVWLELAFAYGSAQTRIA